MSDERIGQIGPAGLPPATRTALKEWAVACQALGSGQQILLLRKGGIREEHREFRVEHPEFLLFPTYEHQRSDLLKPAAREQLERLLAARPPADLVEIRYWAAVAEVFELTEQAELTAVSELHLWSDEYAQERLRWRPRKPLHLMALRVYRLPQAVTLASRPEFGGCKSWLTLADTIAVEGARPVLGAADFQRQLGAVRAALAVAAEVRA